MGSPQDIICFYYYAIILYITLDGNYINEGILMNIDAFSPTQVQNVTSSTLHFFQNLFCEFDHTTIVEPGINN